MFTKPKMLTGEALIARAQALGVNIDGEGFTTHPHIGNGVTLPNPAPEHEIQCRVIDAERYIREHRLWWVALISAIASVASAITALVAVFMTR